MPAVVISGASRGLGHCLNEVYLARGWTTFPVVRKRRAVETLGRLDPERCRPILADIARDESETALYEQVSARVDRVDLLINNAGVPGEASFIEHVTSEEVGRLLQVHCLGAIRCTRAVLPLLRKSARPCIVNITSRLGSMSRNEAGEFDDQGYSYSYRIAKAAQNMFTLCLSHELRQAGVVVVAVHPGQLLTESGSHGADTSPAVAAARLALWLESVDAEHGGRCFALADGEIPW